MRLRQDPLAGGTVSNDVQEDHPSEIAPRDRGGCLSAFLIAMVGINGAVAVMYMLAGMGVVAAFQRIAWWALWVLAATASINLVAALALWRWQRWGLYVFIACTVVVFGLNTVIGVSLLMRVIGLIGPIILGLLMRSRWRQFT